MRNCNNCPNAEDCPVYMPSGVLSESGPGRVETKADGSITYSFVDYSLPVKDVNFMGEGTITPDELRQRHPDLADKIENCEGAVEKRTRISQKLRLRKPTLDCRALDFDWSNPVVVRELFGGMGSSNIGEILDAVFRLDEDDGDHR